MLPKNLSNYFILTNQTSEKNTRLNEKSKKTLHIPFYKTSRLQRCIKYQGVKIWNKFPFKFKMLLTVFLNMNLKSTY